MLSRSDQLKRLSLFVASAFAAGAILAGCSGSDGAKGDTGATGAQGPAGVNANDTLKVSQLSADQFAALKLTAAVTKVSIAGKPVVDFTIKEAGTGKPVVGWGSTSKSSTATVASYPNAAFSLAKLVPASNGSPSKWVSYIVTSVPTTTAASTPAKPTTDSTGTLVDNGDGSYRYTFYRDVTTIKATVAALADPVCASTAAATCMYDKADLGDLTYDSSLTHRLVIQISGNAPGTGTNTPTAVQTVTGVPMVNPVNVIYDFVPATGKAVAATDPNRVIVDVASCNECHSKLALHGGGRIDTSLCVICHNDQRKYGSKDALDSFNTATNAFTITTTKVGGMAVGNFPAFIHRLHAGEKLSRQNYNYGGVLFNETTYPQPLTNCTKCHDGSATAAHKTPQGDNWKNNPSRLACGACHDGINFATGLGKTIGGASTGHEGRAQADDSKCYLCHDAASVRTDHVTVAPLDMNDRATFANGYVAVASQLYQPAGAYKIGFEIKQVTVSSTTNKASVVYRIMDLSTNTPFKLNTTGTLLPNIDGTPSIYVAYATVAGAGTVPTDGLAAPADWSKSINATVLALRDGVATAGSQTGPDASGYYTATLATALPADAKLVTGAIGINYTGFVQTNLPGYQVKCTATSLTAPCGPTGLRLRESEFKIKTADGYTARRQVVSNAKCNNCHGQLGVEPTFHNGARNNGEGCAMCHTPDTSTGHTGAANNFGGGWSVAVKNLVHGIHGSSKRTVAYSYEATATNPGGFAEVTYPGILNNCEQCHIAGAYDFSLAANAAAQPNLLWTTEAKADMSNPTNAANIGLSPWISTLGRGQVSYTTDNLVSSPVASSCFGCHDTSAAIAHMKANGGNIYATASSITVSGTGDRSKGYKTTEQCMICHATGKVADIKVVHGVGQ